MLKRIVRANAREDKPPVLLEIREDLEEIKVLLRLTHDAKGFPNFNSFEHTVPRSQAPPGNAMSARLCLAAALLERSHSL